MQPPAKISKSDQILIRKATRADSRAVIGLIIGLARFEKLRPPDSKGRTRLIKDIFDKKLASVFVAETFGMPVGYALYFYTYSSFVARPTLYLEDIFVKKQNRGEGVGEALFMKCVNEAARKGCGRMEWQVLTWNKKAMRFYEGLGAKKIGDLRLFRINRESLQRTSRVTPA